MIILHHQFLYSDLYYYPTPHPTSTESLAHIIRQRSSPLWGGQALVRARKEERKSSGEGLPSGRAPRKKSYAGWPRS